MTNERSPSLVDRIIRYCLEQKLVVALGAAFLVAWGVSAAPFDWEIPWIPRDPTPVDAIPDIGENQQIVYAEWEGRSPRDVENQVTYPLTAALQGAPGVRTIRSISSFGFATIYVIFKEDVEFYWSRSRVLEKLSSLPADLLPEGVRPQLGPDATGLGQIFWYTLEGRDAEGRPAGGWDLEELRRVQDWYVRYPLLAAGGVSEVASIGGFVREYQVEVRPDALRAFGVGIQEVSEAVRNSNLDVGARSLEHAGVQYFLRGLGFLRGADDLERTVVRARDGSPVLVRDLATVSEGPAFREGLLNRDGAEAVGGVVVARYGENPLQVIKNVKAKIAEIAPGLPKKTLADGTVSQVSLVPFYDRSGLIQETLGTLREALYQEVLVNVIVIVALVFHLRSSLVVSGLMPLAILVSFIGMKLFRVDANIVSLSGIAIAIGELADMGIVLSENILKHLERADPKESRLEVVYRASSEVGSAVLTSVTTTVVSFLPVFAMEAAEGKLFRPLAYTKTFALVASIALALTLVPPLAHALFRRPGEAPGPWARRASWALGPLGLALLLTPWRTAGIALLAVAAFRLLARRAPPRVAGRLPWIANGAALAATAVLLTQSWMPLGPAKGLARNLVLVVGTVGGLMAGLYLFQHFYEPILRAWLRRKALFLAVPAAFTALGLTIWLGFDRVFAFLPESARAAWPLSAARASFPGMGKEFMPSLNEGSFLFMPSAMPHASIGEASRILETQVRAIRAIPEVETVVGKLGRVESALDPAPVSMYETLVSYKPEYREDGRGERTRFRYDEEKEEFLRGPDGALVPDPEGEHRGSRPYRQWRAEIRSPADIWAEIARAGAVPGTTGAPKLQPIETRILMLQTGMRAPMGVKVRGRDLAEIERAGFEIERLLKEVPAVEPSAVVADRIVGTPYLEIEIDRDAAARYGVSVMAFQEAVETALGGRRATTTVEGRERYGVRVRYPRELRGRPDALGRVAVSTPSGAQIPLEQLARIAYRPGPMMIRSEDAQLVGYVLFDRRPGVAEVDAAEQARAYLDARRASGELELPEGVTYVFSGSYENQQRAARRLAVVLPVALLLIFLILYFQFRRASVTLIVFSGIFVAWAGGFLMLWLYGRPWFLDFDVFGVNLRDLFAVRPYNLSVAVWVGFLSLFGIATSDGVIMATYLDQSFAENRPATREAVREAVVQAGLRRVRPCLMTAATTILGLVPVLTSTGRGSDVMAPMAIPSFGGMTLVLITMFVVPTLYCRLEERRLPA